MLKSFCTAVIFILVFLCSQAMSEVLVSPSTLSATENAVVTADGRYFVAGESGIQEVKVPGDSSPQCLVDPAQGLTVCTLVESTLDGEACFFSGMTTDGTYLYAACTVMAEGLLSAMSPPTVAALFRILPGESGADEVVIHYLDNPAWYNGMTMLDDNTILMSRSQSGSMVNLDGPAIEKLTITDHNTFDFQLSVWLESCLALTIPNGIQYDGRYVYFAAGQSVYRIKVLSSGAAGSPVLIYQAPVNKLLDDLAIVGNWLAVAEVGAVNGLGLNSITWVHKLGTLLPWKTSTGWTQLSHLVVDPGLFGAPGSLIGTSYYQGGVYYFSTE